MKRTGYQMLNAPRLPDGCTAEDGWRIEFTYNSLPATPAPEHAMLVYDVLSDSFVDMAECYDLSRAPAESTHVIEVKMTKYKFVYVNEYQGFVAVAIEDVHGPFAYFARLEKQADNRVCEGVATFLGAPIERRDKIKPSE